MNEFSNIKPEKESIEETPLKQIFNKWTWGAFGIYLIFVISAPLVTVHLEFSRIGGLIIRSYPSLFLYAPFFGFLLPFCLAIPIRIISSNKLVFRIAAILVVLIAISLTISDVQGGNMAIWEIKEKLHSTAIYHTDQKYMTIEDHFVTPPDTTNFNQEQIKEFRGNFEEVIKNFVTDDTSNWSITRYAYFISVFFQAFIFLSILISAGIISIFSNSIASTNENKLRNSLISILFSLMLTIIWMLLKIVNTIVKEQWYQEGRLITEMLLTLAVFMVLLFCVAAFWQKFREEIKPITGSLSMLGIVAPGIAAYFKQSFLLEFFGPEPGNIYNYVLALCYVIILMFFFVLSVSNIKVKFNLN